LNLDRKHNENELYAARPSLAFFPRGGIPRLHPTRLFLTACENYPESVDLTHRGSTLQ